MFIINILWCNNGGMKPLNRNSFVRELKDLGYPTKQMRVPKDFKHRDITTDRVRIFVRG